MKLILIAVIALFISACGSFHTIPKSDQAIADNLKHHETKCTFLPQIYSGIAYDFCRLNARYKGDLQSSDPSRQDRPYPGDISVDREYFQYRTQQDGKAMAMLLATDFVLSGVIDTIALPFTIYKQAQVGSVELD